MKKRENVRKRITFLLLAAMIVTSCMPNESKAKTTKPAKITLNLNGKKTVTKKPAALKKAKKVTVKNTKKSVVKVSVKKKKLTFTAKKKGKATVTVICRLKNNKKKTYRYHVTVKGTKTQNTSIKGKKSFTGNLKAEAQKSGAVKLSWTKMKDAKLYHLERRTDKGAWKKIAHPSGTSYLDRTCVSGTTYGYRMKARLSDEWTEYGKEVVVTANKKETTAVVETGQTVTPDDIALYNYEINIVNNTKYHIYNNQKVLMYIKTDYPELENIKVEVENGTVYTPLDYVDVKYNQEKNPYNIEYDVQPVNGGYLLGVVFDKAGMNTIKIKICKCNELGTEEWNTVKEYKVLVLDFSEGESKWIDEVIKENTNSEMSVKEKMEKLKIYVRSNFTYDLSDKNGNAIYLAGREGVYWERGWIDCWDATAIIGKFAEKLNLSWEWTYAGYQNHYYATVYINGEACIYDACPFVNTGVVETWNYIL